MANTVTVTTLLDSPKMAVLHVYLKSDGIVGELANQVLFDASALSGGYAASSLEIVDASLAGFSAVLGYDATTDVPVLVLPTDEHTKVDYRQIVSMKNPQGSGTTGDITITTSGFTAATDEGTII